MTCSSMSLNQSTDNVSVQQPNMSKRQAPTPSGSSTSKPSKVFKSDHLTKKKEDEDDKNFRKMKRSIVEINNATDSMCLARAIVVGRCHANRTDTQAWKKKWSYIRKSERPEQEKQARALLHEAGISPECACGPSEWGKLQAILRPEYQLKIYSQEINGPILFSGANTPGCKAIHVYYNQNHYDCITSITGFKKGCVKYCKKKCVTGYTHREDHECQSGSQLCNTPTPCTEHFDTDSCMHVHHQDKWNPPLSMVGWVLGRMNIPMSPFLDLYREAQKSMLTN